MGGWVRKKFKNPLFLNHSLTNFHLILALTPIQRHQMISEISYEEVFLNEQIFMVKKLKTRYRNSHKITQLIKYLNSKFKNLCLQMDENSAPCLSGTFPVWIDIGANHQLIVSTIEIIQRQFYQDKHGGSLYLLYDDDLHEDVMKKLQSCWEDSRTCMNWRSFIGCETETIIFITYGVGKGLYFGETQCQNKSVEIIYYICTLGCSDYQKKTPISMLVGIFGS